MIQVLLIANPFQPFQDLVRTTGHEGETIREWLAGYFGEEFQEFERPTVCQLNGEMLVRERWSQKLKDGDVLAFVALPGDPVSLIIAAVSIIVAVAVVLLMPTPQIPGDNTNSSSSVYTLRGQNNSFRPNEPIEVSYGKVRHWPTFAARPYSEYIGNDQYQFSLYCLGQGEFTIHETMLDDTPTSDYEDVTLEIIAPGDAVTLVESAVVTAAEVSNLELLPTDDDDFDGPIGPFTVNPFDQPVHRLAVDVSFPQGLYSIGGSKGYVRSYTVELLFEYRQIDEAGDPIGSWTTLANPTISLADNTPQRITYSASVTYGRYEVRGVRETVKGGTSVISKSVWDAVKGYAKDVGNFGNVTMIAMKAKATNNLNDQTSQAFNVVATRKLPTWTSGGGWAAATATRNPVWAMCDVFRSEYGAFLDSEYLDMPSLKALADDLDSEEINFDWTFDSPITIWEAASTIMRVARAVPIPQGSVITAVMDVAQTLPAAVFNQHNIVAGSLNKTLDLFEFQAYDGMVVEYTDPDTWLAKEVTCILPGRAGTNLERIKLAGCTSRQKAYREGMYLQTRREYQRKTVTFKTGLEGHIPSYMDLVSVTHDTVRVGQGGMVLAYNSSTNVMTLSDQVTFASDNIVHKIVLRGDDGAIIGNPITCTRGAAPNQVILASDPDTALDFSTDRNPPLYAFGVANLWGFLGKVARITPVDMNTVELTLVNYVPECYTHDADEPTGITEVKVLRNPSNPTVSWVNITPVPNRDDRVFVDWLPVPGSASYLVEVKYQLDDDPDAVTTWSRVGTFAAAPVRLTVNKGTVKVRVAPFSRKGNLKYTSSAWYVVGSNIPVPDAPDPKDPQPAFTALEAKPKWNAVTGVYGYEVEVRADDNTTVLRTADVGTALLYVYDNAMLLADTATRMRDLYFHVSAYGGGGGGPASVIPLSNPLPTNNILTFTPGTPSGTDYPATWTNTEEADHRDYVVFTSTTPGFTAGPGNQLGTTASQGMTIPAPVTPLYVRIGIRDVWGDDYLLSSEFTIP